MGEETLADALAWILRKIAADDGPRPVREWENCDGPAGCGHPGGECDCRCCTPDTDDSHEGGPDEI